MKTRSGCGGGSCFSAVGPSWEVAETDVEVLAHYEQRQVPGPGGGQFSLLVVHIRTGRQLAAQPGAGRERVRLAASHALSDAAAATDWRLGLQEKIGALASIFRKNTSSCETCS